MILLRLLGWLCILAAMTAFGFDVWRWWIDAGAEARFALTSIAEIWVRIDANSLVGLGALFQSDWFPENPELFTDWVVPILAVPAALPLAVLGLAFVMVFRRRRRAAAIEPQ